MMATEFYSQHAVWERYMDFEKLGMRESFLILFNGWVTMDGVLDDKRGQKISDFLLTDNFLEEE